jgi:hypothetical protein
MPEPVDTVALAKSWTHSHEEDSGGLMVFRRSESEFPPSRGRMSFDLNRDGVAHLTGPGPDDRRIRRQGTWNLDGNLLTLRLPGRPEQRFEIQSVDDQRLVARRTG